MKREDLEPIYHLLVTMYLSFYRFGFEMMLEDELKELKGAEDSLKLELDPQLFIDAVNPRIKVIGRMSEQLIEAFNSLANLNQFEDPETIIDQMAEKPDSGPMEELSLETDFKKHISRYDELPEIDKIFVGFVSFSSTFLIELNQIVGTIISRESKAKIEPEGKDYMSIIKAFRPYADTNGTILLDMIGKMNDIFREHMMLE